GGEPRPPGRARSTRTDAVRRREGILPSRLERSRELERRPPLARAARHHGDTCPSARPGACRSAKAGRRPPRRGSLCRSPAWLPAGRPLREMSRLDVTGHRKRVGKHALAVGASHELRRAAHLAGRCAARWGTCVGKRHHAIADARERAAQLVDEVALRLCQLRGLCRKTVFLPEDYIEGLEQFVQHHGDGPRTVEWSNFPTVPRSGKSRNLY